MYQLRSTKPLDSPGWWTAEQCKQHFIGQTTEALQARLIALFHATPADTGVPPGQPREAHCPNVLNRCPLCEAWVDWGDETAALSKELRRRGRCLESWR